MAQASDTKKPKYDPKESDFCYYPFFEILLSVEGKFKPCAKHLDFVTHHGKDVEIPENNVEFAWNSDYMNMMRDNFKSDVRTKGCVECWREQKLGLRSMRYDSYLYGIPMSQVENPETPMKVEINASNVCNLRCRICSPYASSKWIREARDLYGINHRVCHNLNEENLAIIKSWVPNLVEIGLYGGEPFLARENIELLRYCVDEGYAKNLRILTNTNTTIYTDEIADLLTQFNKVLLNFSIDDIGARFEYQRKGAVWDEVLENMKKFIALGGYTYEDQIECKINCAVTSMNIYYYPEYFQFMNEHFPGLPVHWNLIYEPWAYSVQILPQAVKKIIAERLRNFVQTTYEMSEERTKTIHDLVTYLEGQEAPGRSFNAFFKVVNKHDKYRNESFAEVFPEFWEHIKEYSPEEPAIPPVMTAYLPDFTKKEDQAD